MGFELRTGSDTNWVMLGCEALGTRPQATWKADGILALVSGWCGRDSRRAHVGASLGASENSSSPFVLPGTLLPFSVAPQ
jgi:hypothetical protein